MNNSRLISLVYAKGQFYLNLKIIIVTLTQRKSPFSKQKKYLSANPVMSCDSPIHQQIMNHNKHSSEGLQKQLNLKNLSTEELRQLLLKVEHQHDVLEATNEELTIQISDLRNAVKCVESEGRENVAFELEKKKKLESKIESLEKGLKYSTKNHLLNAMESFKALQQ